MEKREILENLKDLFEDKKISNNDEGRVFQYNTIDKEKYISLIIKDGEKYSESDLKHPEFDRFITILKSHQYKDFTYETNILQNNRIKILKEIPEDKFNEIIAEMDDLSKRLISANDKNRSIVHLMIKDFIKDVFEILKNY